MSMTDTRTIRRDGKPARRPLLGVPAGVPKVGEHDTPPGPSWYELVLAGPKGDPKKALKRAEAVRHGVIVKQEGTGIPRAARRAAGNRRTVPGSHDLHRTRLHPVDGGPRPDVLRRRLERIARSAS